MQSMCERGVVDRSGVRLDGLALEFGPAKPTEKIAPVLLPVRLPAAEADRLAGALKSAEDWGTQMTRWSETEYSEYQAYIAKERSKLEPGEPIPWWILWESIAIAWGDYFRRQPAE